MTTLRFRPDIEGLRGLAVVLVVAYHAGLPGLSGGFVGVDVFFTLSGYLITRLLLDELEATGRVSLTAFYARRIRRLLPAASLVIVATLLLSALVYGPGQVTEVAVASVASALSLSNLLFSSQALDYFRDGAPSPLLHTWSLAVEEQFYLFWPVLIIAAAGRRADRDRLGAALAVVIVVSLGLCWWWTIAQRPVAFFGTPYRAWEFAVGGLAGLIRRKPPQDAGGGAVWTVAGWSGLAAIMYAAFAFTDRTLFPGLNALAPVLGTAFVLVAAEGCSGANPGRVLSSRVMQWLGRHSYGWYLWHWPILVIGGSLVPGAGLAVRAALAVGALLIATQSLRLLEEPIRRGQWFHVPPSRAIAGGAALMASVAMLALGVRHLGAAALAHPDHARFEAARADIHPCRPVWARTSAVSVCTLGAPDGGGRTIALFGDSHASQWVPALELIAEREGWQLLVLSKSACPSVRITLHEPNLNREFHECDAWRAAALDTLRARRPEVIIVSNASAYVTGGPRPGDRTMASLTEWESGLGATVSALKGSGSAIILLADTPVAPENVPDCLTRLVWQRRDIAGCDFESAESIHVAVLEAERRVAALAGQTLVVDLTEQICSNGLCRAWDGSNVLFRDSSHLTASAVRALQPALHAALVRGGYRQAVAARSSVRNRS